MKKIKFTAFLLVLIMTICHLPLAVGAESAAILMRYDMYVPKK